MSKLNELIDDLCPLGVQYAPIGELCTIQTGDQLNKEFLSDQGEFPVYNGGIYPSGYYNQFNTEANTIAISQGGASAGFVNWVEVPFYAGAHCYTLKSNSSRLVYRYLYFCLKNEQDSIQSSKQGAGIPGLSRKIITDLYIPLPPFPIQQEIVRILDTFTKLQAELEAELEARNKQFFTYRSQLLSFNENTPYRTLGDISKRTYSGSTPLVSRSEYYNGEIPWLRTQEIIFQDIYDTEIKITNVALQNTSVKWIPENCVIIAISGATAGRSAVNKIPLTTNQHCLCLEVIPEIAYYRYVFHWIGSQYQNLKSLGQGARSDLNSSIIKGFPIPIPTLDEQMRIAKILDNFDLLCQDPKIGILAEIEARRKQYEYYRNKLLTFKEKVS
jgi:type I restriction enzyme, S subunit